MKLKQKFFRIAAAILPLIAVANEKGVFDGTPVKPAVTLTIAIAGSLGMTAAVKRDPITGEKLVK